MVPVFSLCYTSCRPNAIGAAVKLWLGNAAYPEEIEVVLALDKGDAACWEAAKRLPAGVRVVEQADLPGNCVKGWNRAAEAATGLILVAMADDFKPPIHWDRALREVEFGWYRSDRAVMVSDGYLNELATLAIVSRVRYERFGYLFYPLYESMFCDTELTMVARMEETLIDARHLVFEHLHPDAGKRDRDATDLAHASPVRYQRGETLFKFRNSRGFPRDTGNPSLNPDFAANFLVVRNDFCLLETCKRLQAQGVKTFFFAVPFTYWNGKPVPEEYVDTVLEVVNRLSGVRSRFFRIDIEQYRQPGERLVTLEGRVRNEALSVAVEDGFDHLLIVDSDELWRAGLVGQVRARIESRAPTSISAGMVPVVGLPGYPVKDAADRAVIYMRSDARFQECRTPYGRPSILPGYPVIHFTACRRTRDEIVAKMRASGHYDDTSYRFEEWIRDTLPHLTADSKNIHMHDGPHNVWPAFREWTPDEWAELPTELKPFLSAPA